MSSLSKKYSVPAVLGHFLYEIKARFKSDSFKTLSFFIEDSYLKDFCSLYSSF